MKHLATALLVILGAARTAHAETPDVRHGFTLGVGLGGGGAYYTPEHAGSGSEPGVSFTLTIGGFVRPNVAIVFHELFIDSGPFQNALQPGISAAGTLAAQYWLGERVNVIGGLGMGVMQASSSNPLAPFSEPSQIGLGAVFGVSVVPVLSPHHAMSVSLEVAPIFSDHLISTIYSGSLSWQYF